MGVPVLIGLIDNWWMPGRSGRDRELSDTAALVGHLVPAGRTALLSAYLASLPARGG
jgi:hypothetical protein